MLWRYLPIKGAELSILLNGAMTGKQRATDLTSKVAIINAVETGIETKLEATNCLGVPYLLF